MALCIALKGKRFKYIYIYIFIRKLVIPTFLLEKETNCSYEAKESKRAFCIRLYKLEGSYILKNLFLK
jgi:hypothetical protein